MEEQSLSQINRELEDIELVIQDIENTMPIQNRFGSSTEGQRLNLLHSRPKSTEKNTRSHLNTWNDWIASLDESKKPSQAIEDLPVEELCECLLTFVTDVRKKDGTYYVATSLVNKVSSKFTNLTQT